MNFYLRVLNPAVALLVFALCYWASTGDDNELLAFLYGGMGTYFFAKGLFCASALLLLGKILLGLFSDEKRATESQSTRAQVVASLIIFTFLAGSFAGMMLFIPHTDGAATSSETVLEPPGIKVVDSYEIRETEYFVIGVTLRNDNPTGWRDVEIHADVSLNGKFVASCKNTYPELLLPSEEQKLLVRCWNLLNERVTEDTIKYTLRVEAEKLPE